MKYLKYLAEHAYWIIIALFITVTSDIFLLTLRGSKTLIVFVSVAVPVGMLMGTYIDFRRNRTFLDNTIKISENLDKKYLLPEVMTEANTEEQRLVREIMGIMERSMGDNVSLYRRLCDEYKEYIETWVHEIKIPIATAEMIITNHGKDSLTDSGIETEIRRISDYVEQALFYARSEAVEKDYLIKPINIEEIVNSAILANKKALRSMRASIDIHDINPAREVLSDGKWISFIVGQILANSIKYVDSERPLKLEIYISEENKKTSLHIKDNGIGIKESELSRVTDKGFTGTNGRIGKASTGMGLYLCNKLCNRLEHTLSVCSTEGVGTEVIITF